jgi:AcrR family transcriptional regulator
VELVALPVPTERAPRRRLSAAARKDALIRATVAVVAKHGYPRASLTKIAETAGVSKGLLWHYFRDNDDLMTQTARSTLVLVRTAVADDLDLTAPVTTIIRSAIARAARLPLTHPDELSAVEAIVANLRDADGRPRLDLTEYDETYAQQEALFRRGQREGSLRSNHDPHLMAVTYQGAVDTMLAYLQTHPDTDPAQHAAALADLLLTGFAVAG